MTIAPPERADALDDATLAQAAARGDRLAFTAIYDRYADRLYDFCAGMLRDRDAAADCVQDVFVIAASKLSQLEDPDRLRAWLYSIARHEALACLKKRRRERPSDELPDIVSGDPDLATIAARHELADLIDEAFGGLSDRDRTVYELAYRHGLDGQELADALGVSHTNARTLLGRVRDGIERSLGALLVCRRAKFEPAACPGLWELLQAWDGVFTVLMRKRVARHIDDCAACESERRRMVNPTALLGAVPVALPAPAWLRDEVLGEATAALPSADSVEKRTATGISTTHRRVLRAALGAALALLGSAAVAQVIASPTPPVRQVGTSVDRSTSHVDVGAGVQHRRAAAVRGNHDDDDVRATGRHDDQSGAEAGPGGPDAHRHRRAARTRADAHVARHSDEVFHSEPDLTNCRQARDADQCTVKRPERAGVDDRQPDTRIPAGGRSAERPDRVS